MNKYHVGIKHNKCVKCTNEKVHVGGVVPILRVLHWV